MAKQGVEFWSAHLSALEAEGVAAKAYAQQHRLERAVALSCCRHQLRQTDEVGQTLGSPAFLPMQVSTDCPLARRRAA